MDQADTGAHVAGEDLRERMGTAVPYQPGDGCLRRVFRSLYKKSSSTETVGTHESTLA